MRKKGELFDSGVYFTPDENFRNFNCIEKSQKSLEALDLIPNLKTSLFGLRVFAFLPEMQIYV